MGPRREDERRRALRLTLGDGGDNRLASGTLGSGALEKTDLERGTGLGAIGKLSFKLTTLEMERLRIDAMSNNAFFVSSPTCR